MIIDTNTVQNTAKHRKTAVTELLYRIKLYNVFRL